MQFLSVQYTIFSHLVVARVFVWIFIHVRILLSGALGPRKILGLLCRSSLQSSNLPFLKTTTEKYHSYIWQSVCGYVGCVCVKKGVWTWCKWFKSGIYIGHVCVSFNWVGHLPRPTICFFIVAPSVWKLFNLNWSHLILICFLLFAIGVGLLNMFLNKSSNNSYVFFCMGLVVWLDWEPLMQFLVLESGVTHPDSVLSGAGDQIWVGHILGKCINPCTSGLKYHLSVNFLLWFFVCLYVCSVCWLVLRSHSAVFRSYSWFWA